MTLNEYMAKKKLKAKDLAESLEISQAYLSQLRSKIRQPSKYLALLVEARTGGSVSARELRPDIKKIA